MNNCVRRAQVCRWMALIWLVIPIAALAQSVTGVGFAAIRIHDPVNGGNMSGYVFYPSANAKGVTSRGPYELDATANAAPIPGAKPLVMISHGHAGSDLGHHDLATYLASHGFLVAAITSELQPAGSEKSARRIFALSSLGICLTSERISCFLR